MGFRTTFLATTAVFGLTAGILGAQAQGEATAETVVATVNGAEITLGQLIMLRSQLPDQYQQLPDDVVFNGLVEQLVNQQLLGDTLADEPKRVGIALANEVRSLRAGEVVNALMQEGVSDADLQAAYDARFEGVQQGMEFNASHILVETEEEAVAVKTLLDGGADFAASARTNSTGPSGPSGGELGWFSTGMMVTEFEQAVLELGVGDVSEPVQTQFGWHLIKLNETRMTERPTLDSLRQELTLEIQQNILNIRVAELTETAEISLPEEGEFDYSAIQNLELLED